MNTNFEIYVDMRDVLERNVVGGAMTFYRNWSRGSNALNSKLNLTIVCS